MCTTRSMFIIFKYFGIELGVQKQNILILGPTLGVQK